MSENNVKYIPEMWLESDKDDDIKVAFMTALFNQWQGHFEDGTGFDADKVDGKHWADIKSYVDDNTQNKLSSFYIGKTIFKESQKPVEGKYTIGFDGIKLFNPDDNVVEPAYESSEKVLPWADLLNKTPEQFSEFIGTYEYINPEVKSPSLYDVFRELFIITTNVLNQKMSQEEFDEYKPLLEIVKHYNDKGYYQPIVDEDTGDVTTYLYNADQLNGIRIFVCTPTMYNELPDSIKEDPHNLVFMIDEEDLHEDGDLQKPIKYNIENPNVCPISQYYKFKVDPDPETGKYTLYYQHPTSNVWISMGVTADQFIDNATLSEKVTQILNSNTNYTLNPSVFKNSFVNLEVDPATDDYPFLTYLKNYYIHGGVYTKPNGTVDRAPIVEHNGDGYHYIDLDTPMANLNTQIGDISSTLENHDTRITNAKTVADSAKTIADTATTNLSNLKDGSLSTIKSLDQRIALLEQNYVPKGDLEWSTLYLGFFGTLYGGGEYNSYIQYNNKLKIARLYLDCTIDYRKSNAGKWVDLSSPDTAYGNNNTIGNFYSWYDSHQNYSDPHITNLENEGKTVSKSPYIPTELLPVSGAVGTNYRCTGSTGPMFIKIRTDTKKMQVYCNATRDLPVTKIVTSMMYTIG